MINNLDKNFILNFSKFLDDVVVFDEIDSTNRIAKELARDGIKENTVITADYQTLGKGRRGRDFFSPKGTGVYFSLVLRPNLSAQESVLVTIVSALAVANTIRELLKKDAKIKWINDVFIDDKKCAGILTEAIFNGDKIQSIIVGIGVNVTTEYFPTEVSKIAGSIGEIDRNLLIASICDKVIKYCKDLPKNARIDEYKQLCFVLNNEVKVITNNDEYIAKAIDIDEKGRLIVEKSGKKVELYTEEVSICTRR